MSALIGMSTGRIYVRAIGHKADPAQIILH
jgi:hypothetical protein